ncbi:MAG: HmuY family protein [Flavobacteriales bacterium]
MQKLNFLLSVFILLFASCDKSSNNDIIIDEDVITFVELNASQYDVNILDSLVTGKFEKFSFSEGDTVSHDNWDVAFSGTTIIVNGGDSYNVNQPERIGNAAVYIAIGVMSDIKTVDVGKLTQDNELGPAIIDDLGISGQGWASYNHESHILSPIAGKILVFRTHDNKYAKMEILYYYDSEDPQPSQGDYGGFYTFNYVYQSNGSINF